MGQPDVSVILCTYNPRADYLDRVLVGLRRQTLSFQHWELLLIDNASNESLADRFDIGWHPNGRHVREDELGLTPARLRGISEAVAELLIVRGRRQCPRPGLPGAGAAGWEGVPVPGVWGGVGHPGFRGPAGACGGFRFFRSWRSGSVCAIPGQICCRTTKVYQTAQGCAFAGLSRKHTRRRQPRTECTGSLVGGGTT